MWFHVLLDHLHILQNQCYKSTKLLISEMSLPGVYIKLADNLVPQSKIREPERKQSELFEALTRTDRVARGKIFKLGSEETVSFGDDKGLFSAVQAAYNNHWVLRTRPEDWWTSIVQTIAIGIHKHCKNSHEDAHCCATFLRRLGLGRLTTHEGKTLSVIMGRINNAEFFQQITSQIGEIINKPEYSTRMATDFSQSNPVDGIVSSIMMMFSFKKFFEYRPYLEDRSGRRSGRVHRALFRRRSGTGGIPGVTMMGTEDDWKRLIEKLEQVEVLLKPIDYVLQMADWFARSKAVLKNLLETYRGNPDKGWWSRIMDIRSFGSGGGRKPILMVRLKTESYEHSGTTLGGWFVQDFLGLYSGDLAEVPSGVNVVPLTFTDGASKEQAALVGGVTGCKIIEGEVTEGDLTFPSVQSVLGWGLLMDPNSVFK